VKFEGQVEEKKNEQQFPGSLNAGAGEGAK
jgi:hypothetical protein